MANDRTLIAQGKTKMIFTVPDAPGKVDIESTDDITAGDGAKHDVMEGKAVYATTTTCNCFEALRYAGIPTHYIKQVDERTFRADRMNMIPIELVARRIATGSYLKRYPETLEGTIFDNLVVEFFLKDDANHDPMMVVDPVGERVLFFNPKVPLAEGFIGEEPVRNERWRGDLIRSLPELVGYTKSTFVKLEKFWKDQNVALVDLKIECGRSVSSQGHGRIHVADVIDNDSWRIWPGGDKTQMKDKQVYRNLDRATAKELGAIKDNYAWVAEATSKFPKGS